MLTLRFRHVFFVGCCGAFFSLIGAAMGLGTIARAVAQESAPASRAAPPVAQRPQAGCEFHALAQTLQAVCVVVYQLPPFGITGIAVDPVAAPAVLIATPDWAPNPIASLYSGNASVLASLGDSDVLLTAPDRLHLTGTLLNLSPVPQGGSATLRVQIALPQTQTPAVGAAGVLL